MLTFFPEFTDKIDCRFLTKSDDRTLVPPYVRLHQVHGNNTILTREPRESIDKADGVITDTPQLSLSVRAADCQSFAAYHPGAHVGGVLHAGWKGLVAGAIPEFFRMFCTTFSIDVADVFVAAGPSLCLSCAEFTDPLVELPTLPAYHMHGRHIDLQQIATDQLLQAGVQRNNIDRHPDCTRCHPETYLTYRGGDKNSVQKGESNVLVLTLL